MQTTVNFNKCEPVKIFYMFLCVEKPTSLIIKALATSKTLCCTLLEVLIFSENIFVVLLNSNSDMNVHKNGFSAMKHQKKSI